MELFAEMYNFWGSKEYWNQVMVGYTDLSTEDLLKHYSNQELNKDACDTMAEHLSDAGPDGKVEWKCKDVWKGNADDINLKKFRKN